MVNGRLHSMDKYLQVVNNRKIEFIISEERVSCSKLLFTFRNYHDFCDMINHCNVMFTLAYDDKPLMIRDFITYTTNPMALCLNGKPVYKRTEPGKMSFCGCGVY